MNSNNRLQLMDAFFVGVVVEVVVEVVAVVAVPPPVGLISII